MLLIDCNLFGKANTLRISTNQSRGNKMKAFDKLINLTIESPIITFFLIIAFTLLIGNAGQF